MLKPRRWRLTAAARWRLTAAALSALTLAAAIVAGPADARAGTPAGAGSWGVAGARNLGPLSPRPMRITLVLAPRNASRLSALAAAPHAALRPAQFAARFAPSPSTIAMISAWATAHRLRVSSVSSNRLLVAVAGSSAGIARALHTQLRLYSSAADGTFYATTQTARFPARFAGSVSSVLGLSSLARVRITPPALRSSAPLHYPAAYGPRDFWSLYDAPSSQTGTGQQLAIITEGNVSQPRRDLATFEQKFGLAAVTWNQVNVGQPSTDTAGNDEWDLDSQYSTGFAPGVSQLDVYVGPSLSNQDILATINRWVTDDLARQGSFSAGECDLLAYASGFTSGLDAVLKQADAQGQSMFFSSGDTGSQCPAITGVNGVPAGIPDTNYPASSPYGIGVGGTTVLGPGPNEIAWYAGGGGISPLEPAASFQSATKLLGKLPLVRRAVPDVSLDADPESGYEVVVAGSLLTIGGTSASAPSWQGIWARAQAAHGATLGFAGPVLYKTEPASAYHDIRLGANGLYTAGPGYDLITGLGTPDIAKFVGGA